MPKRSEMIFCQDHSVDVISVSDSTKEHSQKLGLAKHSSFSQPPLIDSQNENSGEWLGMSSLSASRSEVTVNVLLH